MNSFTVSGATALLKWGYHDAAQLSSWTLEAGGTVTATVVSIDQFRASQAPLTFVVPRPTNPWVWKVNSLQIAGKTLVASLAQE